jgi:hypothetical protein
MQYLTLIQFLPTDHPNTALIDGEGWMSVVEK